MNNANADIPNFPPAVMPETYPYEETDSVFRGPDVHPDILGLLPFIGLWRGLGKGGYPTVDDFTYAQEVRISHDGRPFLAYEARSWRLDDNGSPIAPAAREVGWWRLAGDDVELLLAHPMGFVEIYVGRLDGLTIQLASDVVARTESAKDVTANHRLYGIVEGMLCYAVDMAAEGHPLTPHLSARLLRVQPTPEENQPSAAASS